MLNLTIYLYNMFHLYDFIEIFFKITEIVDVIIMETFLKKIWYYIGWGHVSETCW